MISSTRANHADCFPEPQLIQILHGMQAAMRSARHQRVRVLDGTSEDLAIDGGW